MNAMKNLLHGVILAVWALAGVVFTFKCLFGGGPVLPGVFSAASWWLWFAGLAALTTLVVKQFERAVAPLAVHAAAFLILSTVPKVFPLSLLRLGLDLLNPGA